MLNYMFSEEGGMQMYHIAICDDDKVFISYMENIIIQALGSRSSQCTYYEYTSGESLINELRENVQYDLLILDMELGGMDGDETARLFREKCKETLLVFCSGVRAPSVKSFKATPFRYLLKSYSDKKMKCEIKEIFSEVEKRSDKKYMIGHYRSNVIKVNVQNILYVENAKRGSRVVVCKDSEEAKFDGLILVDDKLEILTEKFSELVLAHSSYAININHIEKIIDNEAYLDSGERLSISRTYQKDFRTLFTKSIADKY